VEKKDTELLLDPNVVNNVLPRAPAYKFGNEGREKGEEQEKTVLYLKPNIDHIAK